MLKNKVFPALVGIFLCVLFIPGFSGASQDKDGSRPEKTAIILASFGTTVPAALESILNIHNKIRDAFPGTPVRITFTSNMIRSVWKKRQVEPKKWLEQGVPEEVLQVKNIIATFGDFLEEDYRNIVVQPTHMFFMEQSHDLAQYVQAMHSIRTVKEKWKPFDKVALGRPALGTVGSQYAYHMDLEKALKTLAPDVEIARRNKAILVYLAHGNEYWPTGIYAEAEKMMTKLYPDIVTYIGAVEGYPGVEEVSRHLSRHGSGKIILKPFMIVAGDHAINDMAGDDEDSWKSTLTRKGFEVIPILKGLGSNDEFAKIFVEHIRDAARDSGIEVK